MESRTFKGDRAGFEAAMEAEFARHGVEIIALAGFMRVLTEGFVQAWLRCLEADLERGGLAAVRHLEAVIRLIQHCESSRPNYAQMTDAELESLAEALASGRSS